MKNTSKEESICTGSFLIYSYYVQYYKNVDGMIEVEGTIVSGKSGVRPHKYEIPYSVLLPKIMECENLIVPGCLSAFHVAHGSLRMEPVYMILGHAAGVFAVMANKSACSVQKVNIKELLQRLIDQKQRLKRDINY